MATYQFVYTLRRIGRGPRHEAACTICTRQGFNDINPQYDPAPPRTFLSYDDAERWIEEEARARGVKDVSGIVLAQRWAQLGEPWTVE